MLSIDQFQIFDLYRKTWSLSHTHLEFLIWSTWLCVSSNTHGLSCSFSLFCATARTERQGRAVSI